MANIEQLEAKIKLQYQELEKLEENFLAETKALNQKKTILDNFHREIVLKIDEKANILQKFFFENNINDTFLYQELQNHIENYFMVNDENYYLRSNQLNYQLENVESDYCSKKNKLELDLEDNLFEKRKLEAEW